MAHRLPRIALLLLAFSLLPVSTLPASAQSSLSNLDPPLFQPPLHNSTPEAYIAHLDSLRSLVRACRDNATACDPAAVGDDDLVESSPADPPSPTFQMRWQWLRKVIIDTHNPALPDRQTQLNQASDRLDQDAQQFAAFSQTQPTPPQQDFSSARRATDAILSGPEFRIVTSQSWFDRKIAEFWMWVNRLFSATANLGHRAPWLGPVLEWSFVGLAVVAALIWVQRTMQRQNMAISLGRSAPATNWQKESAEWADLAHTEAELGNWRDAIHCLYWAAIIALERRRLWSRNYARTPREYLPLLEAHSAQQAALRSLTGIFERIWYGLRGAAREDYTQALALFEDLRKA